MKRTIWLLAAIAAFGFLLAGCTPAVSAYNPTITATQTPALTGALTTLQTVNNTALTITANAGTIKNTTGQVYTLTFNAVVDAATVSGAITFNALATAADAFTPNVMTPLPYTSVVNGKNVIFTINATNATNPCMTFIDATKLTANNGAIKLDTNGNLIQGEAEDSIYGQVNVTINNAAGATAPAGVALITQPTPNVLSATNAGQPASSALDTLSYAGGLLAGGSASVDIATYTGANIFTFTLNDTGSATTDKFAADLSSAVTVTKCVAGVWTAVAITVPYVAATHTATITLTTAPIASETYKIVVNKYNLVESTAVKGYIHRVSYDKNNNGAARDNTFYINFRNAGGGYQSLAGVITSGQSTSNAYGPYVDIAIPGGSLPIDTATILPASVLVKLAANTPLATGTAPQEFLSAYTLVSMETSSSASLASDTVVRHFRLYLPSTVKSLLGGAVNRLIIAPSVLTPIDTTTAANSKNSFGAAATGWATYNF